MRDNFTSQCGGKTIKDERVAFVVTTTRMTMETMSVTETTGWPETQNAAHV